MQKIQIQWKKILFYTFILSLFLGIISLSPLVGDDWGWGSGYDISLSIRQGISLWENYNGRVLGHALVFFMSSHPAFKIILMAVTFTLIVYFIGHFTKKSKIVLGVVGAILLLGAPLGTYREVLTWMSGFSNFGIPALAMVWYFFLNRKIFDEDWKDSFVPNSWFATVGCFCLGFLMNLFSEHSAIFSVILGLGMIIITYILHRKIYKSQIAFFLGAALGCGLMFASPSYWGELVREVGSPYEGLNIFEKIIYNIKNSTWFADMTFNNLVLNGLLSFTFLFFFKKEKNVLYRFSTLALLGLSCIIFPAIFIRILKPHYIIQLLLVLCFFGLVVLNLFVLYWKQNKGLFLKLICLFGLAYVAGIPLLAAQSAPRCLFNAYLILGLFLVTLMHDLLSTRNFYPFYNVLLSAFLVLIVIGDVTVVLVNHYQLKNREEAIANYKLDPTGEFEIRKFKFYMFIHQSGIPATSYHEEVFKHYYELPEDTALKIYY